MFRRLSLLCMLSLVAGALAVPSAMSFTLENDPAKGGIPKFDFDEQLRQFRNSPQVAPASANKKGWETPIGTLQFGVSRGPAFGTPLGGFGSQFGGSGNADRKHYERLFAPPHRQHEYD
jgi:hypothetical protein